MLRHLLLNDPRPHYFHQSNLAEDGTFYPVVDEVLARFKAYLTVGLDQPYFRESSVILSRQAKWASAPLSAYYKNGVVYVTNPGTASDVPVTGVTTGAAYGGEKSLWSRVSGFSTKTFTAVTKL